MTPQKKRKRMSKKWIAYAEPLKVKRKRSVLAWGAIMHDGKLDKQVWDKKEHAQRLLWPGEKVVRVRIGEV